MPAPGGPATVSRPSGDAPNKLLCTRAGRSAQDGPRGRAQSAPLQSPRVPFGNLRLGSAQPVPARKQQAWSGSKRPVQQWTLRPDWAHYEKLDQYKAAETGRRQPTLASTPSHDAEAVVADAHGYAHAAAADVDMSFDRRRSSGVGVAALRRLSLVNRENQRPALLALLEDLHEPQPKVEELTDGGVAVPAMQVALSGLPDSNTLVSEDTSAALAMEEALEADAARGRYIPRARQPVRARLERLEQQFLREINPCNQVERVTMLLQRHRENLQAKFAEWDADGDGQITKAELVGVVESLGLEARQGEIEEFFAEHDPDDSGTLDLKEFYGVAYSGRAPVRAGLYGAR